MKKGDYDRIGACFTPLRNNRREQFGLYIGPSEAYGQPIPIKLYTKYEGYREMRPEGEAQVGLPMGGPGWRAQPLTDFVPTHYDDVRFFDMKDLTLVLQAAGLLPQ